MAPTPEEWEQAVLGVREVSPSSGNEPDESASGTSGTRGTRGDEGVTDLPSIEQLELQLGNDPDPWNILRRVRQDVKAGEGGNCTDLYQTRAKFTDLVYSKIATVKSESQREMLMTEAKVIFHVPIDVIRKEVERLSQYDASVTKIALSVVSRNDQGEIKWLAEAVEDPDPKDAAHPVKFLKWNYPTSGTSGTSGTRGDEGVLEPGFEDGWPNTELETEVESGGVLYRPPSSVPETMILPRAVWLDEGDEGKRVTVVDYDSEETLFNDVLAYLTRTYYFEDEGDALLCAGYVMMTWLHDRLPVLGYFRALGLFETGKSHLINTMGHACYHPTIFIGTMSSAVIFRRLDTYGGTLVIDEADFDKHDPDIMRILNGGYTAGVKVPRCVGDAASYDVKFYNLFGPKILAGREEFPDPALESRCFRMDTKSVDGDIIEAGGFPDAYTENQRNEARELHTQLLAWRLHKYHRTTYNERQPLGIKLKRGKQILKAILTCIDTPALRARLISTLERSAAAIRTSWIASIEGRVVLMFLDLIKTKNVLNYDKRVTVAELSSKLNAGKELADRLSEDRIGRILRGLGFVLARDSKGNGYCGGEALKALVKRYELDGGTKKPLTAERDAA